MAHYVPAADHIFLSEEAQALSDPDRELHAEVAERLLGLSEYESTAGSAEEATALAAVARQITVQVAMVPEFSILESVTRGGRSETYRDIDALVAVDPLARQLAQSLLDDAVRPLVEDVSTYASMQSVRGRNGSSTVSATWRGTPPASNVWELGGMRYPHTVVITAAAEGDVEQDPDTGEFVPPERTVVHEGRCDCQDVGEAVVYGQDQTGHDSEAVIFLKEESAIWDIRPDMVCSITFDPDVEEPIRVKDAVVRRVTIMDGTLKVDYLLMFDIEFTIEKADNLAAFAQLQGEQGYLLCLLLESVGWDTISHLRSHTGMTRPPVRKGEPVRPAHPGGWADITTDLVNAYRFEIHANGRRVRWIAPGGGGAAMPKFLAGVMPQNPRPPYELWFFNDMEYAAALEALDGYFVLAGVTDPGGPVERAIRAAIAARPDWRLT